MKFLYKYPQRKFPYEQLVSESVNRSREVVEYELLDTGIFDDDRYWDVFIEVRIHLILLEIQILTRNVFQLVRKR